MDLYFKANIGVFNFGLWPFDVAQGKISDFGF